MFTSFGKWLDFCQVWLIYTAKLQKKIKSKRMGECIQKNSSVPRMLDQFGGYSKCGTPGATLFIS